MQPEPDQELSDVKFDVNDIVNSWEIRFCNGPLEYLPNIRKIINKMITNRMDNDLFVILEWLTKIYNDGEIEGCGGRGECRICDRRRAFKQSIQNYIYKIETNLRIKH